MVEDYVSALSVEVLYCADDIGICHFDCVEVSPGGYINFPLTKSGKSFTDRLKGNMSRGRRENQYTGRQGRRDIVDTKRGEFECGFFSRAN